MFSHEHSQLPATASHRCYTAIAWHGLHGGIWMVATPESEVWHPPKLQPSVFRSSYFATSTSLARERERIELFFFFPKCFSFWYLFAKLSDHSVHHPHPLICYHSSFVPLCCKHTLWTWGYPAIYYCVIFLSMHAILPRFCMARDARMYLYLSLFAKWALASRNWTVRGKQFLSSIWV